jgi:hypothetical protein
MDGKKPVENDMTNTSKKIGTEKIPGGLAKGMKPSDFDPAALAKGVKVEMEHTDDPAIAKEIASDHLTEDQRYYDKLEQMEKKAANKVADKWLQKIAAEVGTDTATIWAIAPESLARLFRNNGWMGLFHKTYTNKQGSEIDFSLLDQGIREHGGAVFLTDGDGIYDVTIPTQAGEMPIVREDGFLPPYGTPTYGEDKTVQKEFLRDALAAYAHDTWSRWVRYQFTIGTKNPDGSFTIPPDKVARWDRQMNTPFDELPPDETPSDYEEADKILAILYRPKTGFNRSAQMTWRVDQAKLRSKLPSLVKAVTDMINKAKIPFDLLQKTTFFRELAPEHLPQERLENTVWVKGNGVFPQGEDSEVLFDYFMQVCAAINEELLEKGVIGPKTRRDR